VRNEELNYPKLMNHIYKNEGILGFYKGAGASAINNFKMGLQFPLYEFLREKTNHVLLSSLTAKAVSTSIFYPLDIIRVMQRNSEKKLSIHDVSTKIYNKQGVVGFYRGVMLYNMISTPNFALMMVFYEMLKKMTEK